MNYVNATPHAIALRGEGATRILEPWGQPIRLLTRPGALYRSESGIEIYRPSRFLGVTDLPPSAPDTYVIVSQIAAMAIAANHPERPDIVYPASGPYSGVERDQTGVLSIRKLIFAN